VDPFEPLLARLTSKRARFWAAVAWTVVNVGTAAFLICDAVATGSWQAFGGWLIAPLLTLMFLAWFRCEVSYRVAQRQGRE